MATKTKTKKNPTPYQAAYRIARRLGASPRHAALIAGYAESADIAEENRILREFLEAEPGGR